MSRIASCSCGQLKLIMQGDPTEVTVCHCFERQKSTGSAFGISAYWPKSACLSIGFGRRFRSGIGRGRFRLRPREQVLAVLFGALLNLGVVRVFPFELEDGAVPGAAQLEAQANGVKERARRGHAAEGDGNEARRGPPHELIVA